jgi:hypothetical protein
VRYLFDFSHHKLTKNLQTDHFSIENNIESVSAIAHCQRKLANHVTKVTAKFPI